MMQMLLTTAIVLAAAVFALWRLLPAGWQLRGLQAARRAVEGGSGWAWLQRRLDRAIAARLAVGGCGSCGAAPRAGKR